MTTCKEHPVIKAVSFDLDGTLIDSTEAIAESFVHTFDVLGVPQPPREAYVSTIGYTLHQQFEMLVKDHPADLCVATYRQHYPQIMREKTFLLPGAKEGLERLADAGLRLGFATSKKIQYSLELLDHFGVLDYFESRIGPEEVSHPKPHPEAVLTSAKELGVSVDELFFVGDTRFDVHAAQAANVRCLTVATGYATKEELIGLAPERVFDALPELIDYILEEVQACCK